jgi:AmmeMemoRadiSam system protein B
LAYKVIRGLKPADSVVVIGGHLHPHDHVKVIECDSFETPLGHLENDFDLWKMVAREIVLEPDLARDNTVEVILPLVKHQFPDSRVFCLRAPPSGKAVDLGRVLASCVKGALTTLVVIGSTDLTHYGPNYGFSPKGLGPNSLEWVREKNDKDFLDAACALDAKAMIRLGVETFSACSAGAAAAAAAFASEFGLRGELLGYGTSCDTHPDDSFVGYGAVSYL